MIPIRTHPRSTSPSHGLFTAVAAACFALACARSAPRTGTVEPAPGPVPVAARDSARPAPPAVDSTTVARRAPVADTLPPRPAPEPARAAARATPEPRAPRDTARRQVRDTPRRSAGRGLIGPTAGARHAAFRDAGSDLDSLWPVKGPAPLPGSILPGKRIVAFYGNPLSRRMGILGEFDPDVMLRKLDEEVATWNRLDPSTPVQPALHLIVLVANASPGPSGKYRTRHDSAMIEKVYGWARRKNALLFVDLQVGQSTLQEELPWIEKFLIRPDVHLGIDPEFSMKTGAVPGTRVGTYDAADINYASRFLANLVDRYKLPPKILVVHRFTRNMLTGSKNVRLDPKVQVVLNMDGWGNPWLKFDSYRDYVEAEPIQFTGFKLFYHNDTKKGEPLLTPGEVLRLTPAPLYIQYQ